MNNKDPWLDDTLLGGNILLLTQEEHFRMESAHQCIKDRYVLSDELRHGSGNVDDASRTS
jgi:hypothetical protein